MRNSAVRSRELAYSVLFPYYTSPLGTLEMSNIDKKSVKFGIKERL